MKEPEVKTEDKTKSPDTSDKFVYQPGDEKGLKILVNGNKSKSKDNE